MRWVPCPWPKAHWFFCLEDKMTCQGISSTIQLWSPLNTGQWPFSCMDHFSSGGNPSCIFILWIFYIMQRILAPDLLYLICGWFRSSISGFAPCDFTEMCEQILGFFWSHIFMENHTFPILIFTPRKFSSFTKIFFHPMNNSLHWLDHLLKHFFPNCYCRE